MSSSGNAEADTRVMSDLRAAQAKLVYSATGGLRGLFFGSAFAHSLESLFGKPFSWRWLFPFWPGGLGDPLGYAHWNDKACSDWIAFGEALDKAQRLAQKKRDQEAEKANAMVHLLERQRLLLAHVDALQEGQPEAGLGRKIAQ